MPVLKNSRHEKFAQALATGMSQFGAHKEAGYIPREDAASRLSRNVKVRARVCELQNRGAKQTGSTIVSCTERLRKAYDLAVETKNPSSAVAATMGEAKLNGLVVDKKQHSGEVSHHHHVDPAKIASDIESKLAGLAANGAQTEVSKEPDAQ